MTDKEKLILDIENLLNSYSNENSTQINPALLEFMDENTLKDILKTLLIQKEELSKPDEEWLNQFKKIKNWKKCNFFAIFY